MTATPNGSQTMIRERVRASARVGAAEGFHHLTFRAMNTECQVRFAAASEAAARTLMQEILCWVADFEARFSRFLDDSVIGRINLAAGLHWVEIDEETDRFFQLCQELWFFTRGAFDPTALPLLKLWNWKATPPVLPTTEQIAAARQLVGWRRVQRRRGAVFLPEPGMGIDLGGIGKEYAVDRVVELMQARGVTRLLVDFGRDVRVLGQAPGGRAWHVGLEDPRSPGRCWCGLGVTNLAVATSGNYIRSFTINGREYGHIIDPRTGWPVQNGCRGVTVLAPSCTVAGILSTTAFVLGLPEGLHLIQSYMGAEGAITMETTRQHTRRFYEHVATENP